MHIVRNLLRQFVSQLTIVPEEIEELYEEFINTRLNHDLSTLTDCLLLLFQTSKTFAVFDALDECNGDQFKYLFALFGRLPRASRILVSSRPHSTQLYKLSDIRRVNIVAHETDLTRFVLLKLNLAGENYEPLRLGCLELIKGVQGMQNP